MQYITQLPTTNDKSEINKNDCPNPDQKWANFIAACWTFFETLPAGPDAQLSGISTTKINFSAILDIMHHINQSVHKINSLREYWAKKCAAAGILPAAT